MHLCSNRSCCIIDSYQLPTWSVLLCRAVFVSKLQVVLCVHSDLGCAQLDVAADALLLLDILTQSTEHEYTESNLSFKHLKGSDRAMVRALSSCPGFDAHLVLVTRTVSGSTVSSEQIGRLHMQ